MSEPLKPCPFCQCNLEHKTLMPGGNILRHPWKDGSCVLSGIEFPTESAPDWNRRTPPASGGRDRPSTAEKALRELMQARGAWDDALGSGTQKARERAERRVLRAWEGAKAALAGAAPIPSTAGSPDAALMAELKKLYQAYVNTLELGRDRIVALGGSCDAVDVMENGDPALVSARAAIAKGTPPLWSMALEEAAKALIDLQFRGPKGSIYSTCKIADAIAAIRALKDAPPAPEQSEECLSDRHHKSDE